MVTKLHWGGRGIHTFILPYHRTGKNMKCKDLQPSLSATIEKYIYETPEITLLHKDIITSKVNILKI